MRFDLLLCRDLMSVLRNTGTNTLGVDLQSVTTFLNLRKFFELVCLAMFRKTILAITVFILITAPGALAWKGKVISVTDGDTIIVRHNETAEKVKIRLYGVDAPETRNSRWSSQPYSRAATRFLRDLLSIEGDSAEGGEYIEISVIDMDVDRYQRTVAAVISLPDGNVVQEELLRAGLAWVYPKYCRAALCRDWLTLQEDARSGRRGLWREKSPAPPLVWRNKQ